MAIDPKGNVFAETGDGDWDPAKGQYSDTVLELSPRDVKLVDYYTPANRAVDHEEGSRHGQHEPGGVSVQAVGAGGGRGQRGRHLFVDAKSMGGADHRTPLYRSPLLANEDVNLAGRGFWGAFATWEDPQGARWLYAPALGAAAPGRRPRLRMTNGAAPHGSIMAFRVEEKDGKPVLTPAWISRDMDVPEPPVVVNGMVFALSNGENTRQLDESGQDHEQPRPRVETRRQRRALRVRRGTGKELVHQRQHDSGVHPLQRPGEFRTAAYL